MLFYTPRKHALRIEKACFSNYKGSGRKYYMNTTSNNKITESGIVVKFTPPSECVKNAITVIETAGQEVTTTAIAELTGISTRQCQRYYRMFKHTRKRYKAKELLCARDTDNDGDCHICQHHDGCKEFKGTCSPHR